VSYASPGERLKSHRLADRDWFQVRDALAAGAPAILPVGSTEQHGPHLPLSTDAVVAEELAAAVARRLGGLVLPTITYGAPSRPRSGGGDGFPSPDVSLPTLLATVESVTENVLAAGAKWFVAISWHWENASVLWDALREALEDSSAKAVLFASPWDLMSAESVSDLLGDAATDFDWASDHAGLLETAIMRHLRPDAVSEPPPVHPFVARQWEVLPTPKDAVPETGVVHDARSVTAAQGAACFDSMVDGLVAAVESEIAR